MGQPVGRYQVTVESDPEHGYRLMVTSHGIKSRVGSRLQRGVPGSGKMCDVLTECRYLGENKKQIEAAGRELEKYLNDFEARRRPKKRRRK